MYFRILQSPKESPRDFKKMRKMPTLLSSSLKYFYVPHPTVNEISLTRQIRTRITNERNAMREECLKQFFF